MLASSWKADTLVEKAWRRLKPPTRDELARRTGIPASNLSAYNTGGRPMTQEMAERICEAVPGLTLAELGAPEELADDPHSQSLFDRQEELRERLAEVARVQALLLDELALVVDEQGRLASRPSRSPSPSRPKKRTH